jgi:hypothetical protein
MSYGRLEQKISPQSPSTRPGCKIRCRDGVGGAVGPAATPAKGELVIPASICLASALSKIMSMNSEFCRPYAEELNRARIRQALATAACLTSR